jgi:hypothetical protein
MALIRPEQTLAVEGSLQLTLEQQILGELEGIKAGQTFMRVVLLGGTYLEVKHDGKLPLIEKTIGLLEKHIELTEKRCEALEGDKKERDAVIRATKWFCGFLAAISGAVAALAVHFLMTK